MKITTVGMETVENWKSAWQKNFHFIALNWSFFFIMENFSKLVRPLYLFEKSLKSILEFCLTTRNEEHWREKGKIKTLTFVYDFIIVVYTIIHMQGRYVLNDPVSMIYSKNQHRTQNEMYALSIWLFWNYDTRFLFITHEYVYKCLSNIETNRRSTNNQLHCWSLSHL